MSRFDTLPDNDEEDESKPETPLFTPEPRFSPSIFELIKEDESDKKKKKKEKKEPKNRILPEKAQPAGIERAPHVLKLVEIPNNKPEDELERPDITQKLSGLEEFPDDANGGNMPIQNDAISLANERFEATLLRAKLEAENAASRLKDRGVETTNTLDETILEASLGHGSSGSSEFGNEQTPPPPAPPRPSATSGGGANIPSGMPAPAETKEPVAPLPLETRVEVRHASGILPALVVDLLSRRRDRKLRRTHNKDIKQLRNEIVDTEERIKQTRARLESETSSLKSSFIKRDAIPSETKNNKAKLADASTSPLVALEKEMEQQREDFAKKQRKAERLQAEELQRLMEKREAKETERQRKIEKTTEKRAEVQPDLQIDHEATPEKTFDRRHEVLDRKSKQPRFDARSFGANSNESVPVPISQILSRRAANASLRPSVLPQAEHSNTPLAPEPEGMYKRSLKSGFYVGVAIIVIGVIAYTLF